MKKEEPKEVPESPQSVDYPDEQNPFASELTEEQEVKRLVKESKVDDESDRRPVTKILPPLKAESKKVEPKQELPKNNEYVNPVKAEAETPTANNVPANATDTPDLNRATKAVVCYYDDENNLLNQFNLAKNAISDKLENSLVNSSTNSNPDLTADFIESTNHDQLILSNCDPLKFIDDSFELIDEEAAANLEAMQREQELAIAESLNYVAETYYKGGSDVDRFFCDAAEPYYYRADEGNGFKVAGSSPCKSKKKYALLFVVASTAVNRNAAPSILGLSFFCT